jgi:DNA-directed RNA polymerase subunit RPC12/RpoP
MFDINGGGTPQPQAKVKLDLSQTTDMTCSKCNSRFFHMAYMFKKVSALISPSGKESLIPIETFACLECGNINREFLPKTMNDNDIQID